MFIKIPSSANHVQIGQKMKWGRPSAPKIALQCQDPMPQYSCYSPYWCSGATTDAPIIQAQATLSKKNFKLAQAPPAAAQVPPAPAQAPPVAAVQALPAEVANAIPARKNAERKNEESVVVKRSSARLRKNEKCLYLKSIIQEKTEKSRIFA